MEGKDEEMTDKGENEAYGERQVKHLILRSKDAFISQRMLLQIIIRGYFHQLTKGCNVQTCKNQYCRSNKETSKLSANESARLAVKLARDCFAKKFHFCRALNPVFPSVTDMGATGVHHKAFEHAIESCLVLKDFTYLRNLIGLFTYTACLDASFESVVDAKQNVNLEISSGINFDDLHQTYQLIMSLKQPKFPFDGSDLLTECISKVSLRMSKDSHDYQHPHELRKMLICLLCPVLMNSTQYLTSSLLKGLISLPRKLRILVSNWMRECPVKYLLNLVLTIQHFITLRLYTTEAVDDFIAYGVRTLSLLNSMNEGREKKKKLEYTFFYNDAVNKSVDLFFEYKRWVNKRRENMNKLESFSFLDYPFVLDPASKTKILHIHSRIQQSREITNSIYGAIFSGQRAVSPYCVLRVDRHNLVNSALAAIVENRYDLKKPLKVHFFGEEGVDEGGVRKEFFSLLIKQLFNVEFGMFTTVNENTLYWFNLNSSDYSEFTLIGQLMGLAIYNKIILEAHFPLLVYKKLLKMSLTMEDMEEIDVDVFRSFKLLMDFDGSDEELENTFFLNFQVNYKGWGSTMKHHDLIPNGENIMVNKGNRKQFLDYYMNWKLNLSIEKQFNAFRKGFHDVVDPMTVNMFKPEELELMVCGSPKIDFDELEKACKYGDGYTRKHRIAGMLWKVLKEFDMNNKKNFLAFCTGSDRIPINGLGKLTLMICKNGDDPKRLPCAHTCYNILLLPEYKEIEVLRKNLMTAITHGRFGFGLQ